jgi:hypothetical protein
MMYVILMKTLMRVHVDAGARKACRTRDHKRSNMSAKGTAFILQIIMAKAVLTEHPLCSRPCVMCIL